MARELQNGVCPVCGKIEPQSAGCSHASCGGIFVAIPHKFKMDLITNRCKICKQDSWEGGLHL